MTNVSGQAVLDLAVLADMYGDDSAGTICPVLTGFRSEATMYIDQLQQAAMEQDFSEIARLSHSLKSMTGLIGANQLMTWCQTMEQAARQHDLPMISTLLPELEQVWSALLFKLDSSLRQHDLSDA